MNLRFQVAMVRTCQSERLQQRIRYPNLTHITDEHFYIAFQFLRSKCCQFCASFAKNASHARKSKLTYPKWSGKKITKRENNCHLHICLLKQRNESILSTTTTPCDEWNERRRKNRHTQHTQKSNWANIVYRPKSVGKSFELSRPKNRN